MKLTYDLTKDAAYIHVMVDRDTEVRAQNTFPVDPEAGGIFLDFDDAGHLVGIDILDASKRLPSEVLESAESYSK